MSTNDIWAVVPIKELDGAKQRLSPHLSPDERRTLAAIMLEDVLDAVSAVRELAGVLVVTVAPVAASLGERYGARVVAEGAREGHTGAVRFLVEHGAEGMAELTTAVSLGRNWVVSPSAVRESFSTVAATLVIRPMVSTPWTSSTAV